MSIDLLVQALLNGFGLAMVYVLVALGLTLIFSILEIINFAHGEFYMLGGYVTYYAYALFGLNYFATLGLAILTVGVAGVVAERLIFHDLRGKALNAFIVSLGLLWVMQAGHSSPSVCSTNRCRPLSPGSSACSGWSSRSSGWW